jgi:flavin-binding protein dodecin
MSVAKNIEITSTSPTSFEDAIEKGIARASQTINNVRGAWIKDQKINVDNGKATEYQVTMILTFVLDGAGNDSVDEDNGGKSDRGGKSGKGKKGK